MYSVAKQVWGPAVTHTRVWVRNSDQVRKQVGSRVWPFKKQVQFPVWEKVQAQVWDLVEGQANDIV